MSVARRRQREKTELRNKILHAARQLFAAQGYESVTMRSIAERIEYSPTAIYSHFADKETLLRELCTHDFLNFSQEFQACALIADPIDKLRQVALTYIRFAVEHPHHYRYMFMTPLPQHSVDAQQLMRGAPDQDAYAFLKTCIKTAHAAGRLQACYANCDLTAQILWSGVHGYVALRLTLEHDDWVDWVEFEKGAQAMLDVLLHGICVAPDANHG